LRLQETTQPSQPVDFAAGKLRVAGNHVAVACVAEFRPGVPRRIGC
jgi:hypothetical protein